MSTLTRRDPWRQLQEDINSLGQWLDPRVNFGKDAESFGWQPAVDVYEDTDGLSMKFEVPEVDPKDIDVHIENGILTVKGERRLEREERKENYVRVERSYGTFSRSFSLPATYDFDKVSAETKHGVLRVFVPKRAEAKPRSIQVKVQQ